MESKNDLNLSETLTTTEWGFDGSHAKVGFSISHFGISETEGRFTSFDGQVMAAKPDFSDAQIEFVIAVNSITTNDANRDTHLKSADFFDTAQFPTITFKSTSLQIVTDHTYKLIGEITLHGITQEITLNTMYKGTVTDPFGNTKAGFKLNGELDRTQFGLVWNGTLAAGGLLVGNKVALDINIELIKK